MYSLFSSFALKEVITEHVPVLAVSVVIAELFFKFHSFTLECLAFLGTWYIMDLVMQKIIRRN